MTAIILEVNSDFARTMNKIILNSYVEMMRENKSIDNEEVQEFLSSLELPPPEKKKTVPEFGMMELERKKGIKEISMYNYREIMY